MGIKIYLAPMSGVTDLPLRLISRMFGAELCFLEMLHSNSILHGNPEGRRVLRTVTKDSPLAAQLLGADPILMLEAAHKLAGLVDISFLDVNSACPVRKVVKKGEGAALLKTPARLGRIIGKLSSGIKLPVTVKLRTGYDRRDTAACVRTARLCEDKGASAIFIHGRTRSQGYSGEVDYASIRAVKKAVRIPVFGSGNIFNPLTAKKMVDETGCDGILVARGALGNPWIFRDIRQYLEGGKLPPERGLAARIKVLKEHLACLNKYNEADAARVSGIIGKVAMWYLKGFPSAAQARARVFKMRSYSELIDYLDGLA